MDYINAKFRSILKNLVCRSRILRHNFGFPSPKDHSLRMDKHTVKTSFLGASSISEFHTALGQFFNYRLTLEEKEPDRTLYLAVPLNTYDEFFSLQFIQKAVQRAVLKLLIYDELEEVISQWIP